MHEEKEDYYTLGNVIEAIKAFFTQYLRKRWWILLLVICAGAAAGAIYFYKQKPKYVAVCTFILEDKSASGGGLSGLASQFGFNLGGLNNGGGIFSGDNILDILKSKKVVQKVLLSGAEVKNENGKTLADFYLDFTKARKNWIANPELNHLNFSGSDKSMTPVQDSVLNAIYESLIKKNLSTERTSKQGTIIKVQVTAENGLFARLMTERLVEEAGKLYMDIRVGTDQENIRKLQRRSDSLLVLLNSKSYRAAASQPLDINPGLRTASVPLEIATRDKTVLATLYGEVTKNLEASKLLLSQQTPVIQLLDRPSFLLDDNKKSMLFLVGVAAFAFAGIYLVSAFVLYFLISGSRKNMLRAA